MTRDPFLRLALIVLVVVLVIGLDVVARELGLLVALLALAGGIVGAVVLSIEADDVDARAAAERLLEQAKHAARFRVGSRS